MDIYTFNNPISLIDSDGKSPIALPWIAPGLKALADVVTAAVLTVAKIATLATGLVVVEDIISKKSSLNSSKKESTVIYRSGSSTNHNLTPRIADWNGLSFTTIQPTGKYTITTVEAVNSTGILVARQDIKNPTHYLVVPRSELMLHEWQLSRETANEHPHFYTVTLKSVLWDSYGNYCGIGGK